jgi:hypothetical protein
MKPYEEQVFADFKRYANVVESWAIYDSVLICTQYYGSEQGVQGWFNSFRTFSQQETHSFFKTRTEGIAGEQYCNMQSADSMDFAFIADSIGLAVMAPAPNTAGEPSDPDGTAGDLAGADEGISHWFQAELPDHMGLQLKIQQDIRAEVQAMSCPPGYGAVGGGAGFGNDVQPGHGDIPFLTNVVTQGVPLLDNRYPLPQPIGIPRTATIEGILHVSEYARTVLNNVGGPRNFQFNSNDGTPPYTFFPQRYEIVFSLFGQRLVQQRAQYHR